MLAQSRTGAGFHHHRLRSRDEGRGNACASSNKRCRNAAMASGRLDLEPASSPHDIDSRDTNAFPRINHRKKGGRTCLLKKKERQTVLRLGCRSDMRVTSSIKRFFTTQNPDPKGESTMRSCYRGNSIL